MGSGGAIRVGIINPIVGPQFDELTRNELSPLEGPDLSLDVRTSRRGPASIEGRYDDALAVPGILEVVGEMAPQVDAIVVNCFGDPGVEAAREITRTPVIGAGDSAMTFATLWGHRFAVVTVMDTLVTLVEEKCARMGIGSRLAGVRTIDRPVLELQSDLEGLMESLARESVSAVKEDGAHVIVLGCTGLTGLGVWVRAALEAQNLQVPVIDPLPTAVNLAVAACRSAISHSGLTYQTPREKFRSGLG